MAVERVKTYVKGLDKILNGGIPESSVVLISGGPGNGKTILCLQFIVNGIKKGEKGLYITFEEDKNQIYNQAIEFGWDLKKLEKEKKLVIKNIQSETLGDMYDNMKKLIDEFKPKRMAVDSLSTFNLYAHQIQKLTTLAKTPTEQRIFFNDKVINIPVEWDGVIIRRLVLDLVRELQLNNITAFLTSEVEDDAKKYSKDGISEFICDGVMCLKKITIGSQTERTIQVVKMRRTSINFGIFSMNFTKTGIEVEIKKNTT